MKIRVVISYDFSDEQRAELAETAPYDVVQGADGVYRATREALKNCIMQHGAPSIYNGNYHEIMDFPRERAT